jgi:hypothetical protein
MPRLEQWANFPKKLRQHLIQRMADRSITIEDLNQLRLWVESNPEVPEGHRVHSGLKGQLPDPDYAGAPLNFASYRWQKHCRGLYQTPIAA